MNEGQQQLISQIGIDRSVVSNFALVSMNTEYIKKFRNVQFILNDNSPIQLKDGTKLGKLIIKDKYFGRLKVKFEKNYLSDQFFINTSLELMVSGSENNLQNLNMEEYRNRIRDVFNYLDEIYTIKVDYSTLRVKKLELNATFLLNEPYELYKQAILMIIRNVSPKRFGNNSSNNAIKYATWHEANMQLNKDNLETALVKNSSIELKIYNKGKQLQDIGEMPPTDKSIMRVEYSIKDKRILQKAFGDDMVSSLSDDKINSLFKKYFNRDVVAPYYAWKSINKKELIDLVKKHREANPSRWNQYFLRDCRQRSEVDGLPTLFDIYDLQSVIRVLEPVTGRNASKKFKNFLKKSIYENDIIGNTKKIKEIISKVMEM